RTALSLLFVLACHARARAQADPRPEDQAPRIVMLPSVEIPEGVESPADGRVELVVTVALDGTGTVEECGASVELCDAIRAALAGARFEPAVRNGKAIVARVRLALVLRAGGGTDKGASTGAGAD